MANLANMNDDEILEHIQEAFQEDGRLNLDYLDFEVVNGSVTISGRVASDDELRIVSEVLDLADVENYKNKVWVDENMELEDADEDEDGKLRGVSFDDDDGEIEEQDYSGEDSEDNEGY